ncbi:MAG: Histidine kinase-, DNA gyrase B-, and HSP90-like ATPase [Pelotomaculum sp. PtaB.Bin013]|uniref:ATP-binding protein n=1 Tax=Pelotomaculum isophthalicicum JI TaxID=947010 RepID=A0A9X4GZ87_9FIRM|nr:ATP-binding protein [Pelotomaculum isophthalicicum]MDF9408497.1 ATP-binding protein [Pelotomaculum isophthalicicum JI]OPX89623.1 MAG: Histidine kinase-, DNA gyrase B-, and HSP90-like ATPase [Pelotomaculum sp. PtaB.Bin013]
MQKCQICSQQYPDRPCQKCPDFIGGGEMRHELHQPIPVTLEAPDGLKYPAEILVLNPIELGLRTKAPLQGQYTIRLLDQLMLEVRPVVIRGKGDTHPFDIFVVQRAGETSSRLGGEVYRLLTSTTGQFIEEISQQMPDHLKELVRQRLMAEVEKSELINAMRLGRVLKYERGRFRHLSGQTDMDLPMEEVRSLMHEVVRLGNHRREVIISAEGGRVLDLHGIPFDYQSGGLLAFDITDIIEKERKIHRQQIQAYREAMAAVTGGRFNLVSREEAKNFIVKERILLHSYLKEPKDIALARLSLKKVLSAIPSSRHYHVLLCFSEALTNVLKHAVSGEWFAVQLDGRLRLVVKDDGPGIKLADLPKATLMQHYSTKNSLGCGFTLITHYADRLYLHTDAGGTMLAMEFDNSRSGNPPCSQPEKQ